MTITEKIGFHRKLNHNSQKQNKYKEHSLLEIIRMSPSLRNWGHFLQVLKVVLSNIWFEIAYAYLGVRGVGIWKEDKEFVEIQKEVQKRTALNAVKLYTLYQFTKSTSHIEGNVAELGVYRGGSAKLMAQTIQKFSPEKKLLIFDTFEGLPSPDLDHDIFNKSDLSDTNYEEVKSYLSECKNIEFFKGLFSSSFPKVPNQNFSFVHIDADLYSSVLECCEFFYPKMTEGGIMLFDDYGFLCAPGAKNAVDEFFTDKIECPIWVSTGQCIVIKQKNKIDVK